MTGQYHPLRHAEYDPQVCPVCQAQERYERAVRALRKLHVTGKPPAREHRHAMTELLAEPWAKAVPDA